MSKMITNFINKQIPNLIGWRRSFHQEPELGFLEYITTYKLYAELKKQGFSVYVGNDVMDATARKGLPTKEAMVAQENKAKQWGVDEDLLASMQLGMTGVVATLDTGRKGDHVAFRFDIDALPILESTLASHYPVQESFTSRYENVMHACGHDGHMAVGLGVAAFISKHREQLKGRFTLLFQPAEEGGRGAKAVTAKGWLDDVDCFYSGHIGIESLPIGTIAASTKGFLASKKLNVHFQGTASHAGMHPELGKNALLATATTAMQLYGIARHAAGVTRINVGKMHAGSGRNIIADSGYMEVEVRGETEAISQYVYQEALRMIEGTALVHDVSWSIDDVGESEEISCSKETIQNIVSWCQNGTYIKEILPKVTVSGSEDASIMMKRVQAHGGKATYMLFGSTLNYPHHHPAFDFEEAVLPVALEAYVNIIMGGSSNG